MDNNQKDQLANLTLAPYIQKATALIGLRREVGGNQFRHAMATLAILIDYGYTDPVLLKASVVHDLLEDFPEMQKEEIECIDEHGPAVTSLVLEVTRRKEPKNEFLERILSSGSKKAKILKVADRISNLTDLHLDTSREEKFKRYIKESRNFILPMAEAVNPNMVKEVRDLCHLRDQVLD